MLKNESELQKKIKETIKGYEIGEVIHAFEVIKIDLLLLKINKD